MGTQVFMAVDIKVMVIWDVMSYTLADETNILEYLSASNSMKDTEDGGSRLFRNIGKTRATSDGIRPSIRKGGDTSPVQYDFCTDPGSGLTCFTFLRVVQQSGLAHVSDFAQKKRVLFLSACYHSWPELHLCDCTAKHPTRS
jgi:hypothetical protein